MRPKNEKRTKRKIATRRKFHSKTNKPRCIYNVAKSDLESLNNFIHAHKSGKKQGKTWKVLPKDSCEVYKDRKRSVQYDDDEARNECQKNDEDTSKPEKVSDEQKVNVRKYKRRCRHSCSSCYTPSYTETDTTLSDIDD